MLASGKMAIPMITLVVDTTEKGVMDYYFKS